MISLCGEGEQMAVTVQMQFASAVTELYQDGNMAKTSVTPVRK